MKELRRERISSFLRNEIAQILQLELKDPRIGFVSVIGVDPTEDLKEAEVRVSVLGTPAEQRTTMRGLNAARGFIQMQLGQRVQFRQTPQLRFVQDSSIEKSMQLEGLLRQAFDEDQAAAEERAKRDQPDVDSSSEDSRQ